MYLNNILNEKGISKLKIAMMANIAPSDFYQAINGKRTFFPAWRKRVSEALNLEEEVVFPEYIRKEV